MNDDTPGKGDIEINQQGWEEVDSVSLANKQVCPSCGADAQLTWTQCRSCRSRLDHDILLSRTDNISESNSTSDESKFNKADFNKGDSQTWDTCPSCGNAVAPGWGFCRSCGDLLNDSHENIRTVERDSKNEGSVTKPPTDSRFLEQVNNSVETGERLKHEADQHRESGEFNRALDIYQEAREAYEEALKTVEESDYNNLININEVKQKISELEKSKQEIHRQRLQKKVNSIRSDLEDAERLIDDGDFENAKERLSLLDNELMSVKQSADQHDLDNLYEKVTTLAQRREQRLSEVTERLETDPIPNEIPGVSHSSVDYDSLTDKEPIGGGGNADVTKAILPDSDKDVTVAIKEPRLSGTLHSDQVERMLEEAETWEKLDTHDYIVGIMDYGSTPIPWIAMEYMDGGHLGERRGQMDIPQALWTALAVTKGVRHAHRRGVAHLDLKPENILFRPVEDAWDVPKVADWGLSKHLLDHSKSVEGMSVEYAAPEQFDEDYGPADDITDVYQLGAVFYELFTGRPPFEGQPFKIIDMVKSEQPTRPSELADVPDALDEILLTALAKEKADRYDDIVYLRDDLQDLFDAY